MDYLQDELKCDLDALRCEPQEWVFDYVTTSGDIDCCPRCKETPSPTIKDTPAPTRDDDTPEPTKQDTPAPSYDDDTCPNGVDYWIAEVREECQWCWCNDDGTTDCKDLEDYAASVSTDDNAIELLINTLESE